MYELLMPLQGQAANRNGPSTKQGHADAKSVQTPAHRGAKCGHVLCFTLVHIEPECGTGFKTVHSKPLDFGS